MRGKVDSRMCGRREWLQEAGGLALGLAAGVAGGPAYAAEIPLTDGHQGGAAIIVGNNEFYGWLAEELQRHLRLLSGAEFPIAKAGEPVSSEVRLLLGGPESNELVAAAQRRKLVDFSPLKQDGFIVQRIQLDAQPALVVGGNCEASTMYAVYELLERLGVVFQLTGDIIPVQKPNLTIPDLHLKMEPTLKYRGFQLRQFVMPWMGLEELKKLIDQMAKLKYNYLEFFWYVGSPWVEYHHRGEKAMIGDLNPKESGYLNWRLAAGTFRASDVAIGREHFSGEQVCAPEFQGVTSPEEAHRVARELLTQVIDYAHQRKIQVWLALGDCPTVPPNLGRHSQTGSRQQWGGFAIPPGDPAGLEIWTAAVKSTIETYPKADGYWVWLAELYFPSGDLETQKVLKRYEPYRRLIPTLEEIQKLGYAQPTTTEQIDSDIGLIHYGKELADWVRRDYPSLKFGIAVLGRSYLFRIMDALIPTGIAFSSMESSAVWSLSNSRHRVPMELFGGMGSRERFLVHRLDEDVNTLGAQYYTTLYYHDRVNEGGVESGLSGGAPYMGRLRGVEQNSKFLAEGAWNPSLTPQNFYREYSRRLYGEDARPLMESAFLALELNSSLVGYGGVGNFPNFTDPPEIRLMRAFRQGTHPLDGPVNLKVSGLQTVYEEKFAKSMGVLQKALAQMRAAETKIPVGARGEWAYLVGKTEQFIMHLESSQSLLMGLLAYAGAFQKRSEEQRFLEGLTSAEAHFSHSHSRANAVAQKLAEMADDPTERYMLFRYNVRYLRPIEEFHKFVKNVVNFYYGQPYWGEVNWDIITPREWSDAVMG